MAFCKNNNKRKEVKYGEGSEIWAGREVAYVPNLSSWEVHIFSANTCYSPKGVPPSVRFGMVVLIKGIGNPINSL